MEKEKRIKVLQVTSMYPTAEHPTLGSFVKSQIDSLRDLVDIELFVVKGLGGILPYFLAAPALFRKLYFGEFDVIHAHYGNIASMVKLIYWGRKPIVTSYCGDDVFGTYIAPGKRTLKSRLFMHLNIFMSRRDSVSIAKSKAMAARIPNAPDLRIIPNGVDLSLFKLISKAEARSKLGLTNDRKVILFPADPGIPLKNFDLLKRALEQCPSDAYTLMSFAGNRVSRDMVPYYFAAADLIAFTSLSEGSPNVIKEAMACNCRIFTTNCGDVTWLLDGVTDAKVLSYEQSEWEQTLKTFLEEASSPVSNSRVKLIEKALDSQSIAKKIADIYSLLVRK